MIKLGKWMLYYCLYPDIFSAGIPEDFMSSDWRPEMTAPCIMQLLCDRHDGLVVEAKTIKEHWWKPHIRKLFDKKVKCLVFKESYLIII